MIRIFGNRTEYYNEVFSWFDKNNGKFIPTWNFSACLFGLFWYLYRRMWLKAIIYLVCAIILDFLTGFVGMVKPEIVEKVLTIGVWIYCGMFGNYDYYLKKRYNKKLW